MRGDTPVLVAHATTEYCYTLSRQFGGPQRWFWMAMGPHGSLGGWAMSGAVARVRAQRALERIRG